jgi:lipopolysaccharide export system protein LptC
MSESFRNTTVNPDGSAPFSELTPLAPLAPRAAVATVSGPWTARLWSAAVTYLPVLVMAMLAALTWWLVKNTPTPGDDGVAPAPRHVPDYEMERFALTTYSPDGATRSHIEGDRMRHFPDNDTVEIDGVRLRVEDQDGRITTASARSALSNGNGTQVRLIGDAHVVRDPSPKTGGDDRVDFRGEFLEVRTDTERVLSHLPVIITTATGEIHASSLDYNHLSRSGVLGGRVIGQFTAQPAKPAAGEGSR